MIKTQKSKIAMLMASIMLCATIFIMFIAPQNVYAKDATTYTYTYDGTQVSGNTSVAFVPGDKIKLVNTTDFLDTNDFYFYLTNDTNAGTENMVHGENSYEYTVLYENCGVSVKNNKLYISDLPITVKYNLNGGSGVTPLNNTKYSVGDSVSLASSSGITKSGCTILGWALTDNATEALESYSVNKSDVNSETGEITFYAVWQEKTTVSIDTGLQRFVYDGTSKTAVLKDTSGNAITLNGFNYTYEMYYYSDYGSCSDTKEPGLYKVHITRDEDADYQAVDSYIEFVVTYSLTYKANTGVGEDIIDISDNDTIHKDYFGAHCDDEPDTYIFDAQAIIKTNTFTKENYTFAFWNTKQDGTGTSYKEAELLTLTENTVLYACYSANINTQPSKDNNYTVSVATTDSVTFEWEKAVGTITPVVLSNITVNPGTKNDNNTITAVLQGSVYKITIICTDTTKKLMFSTEGTLKDGVVGVDNTYIYNSTGSKTKLYTITSDSEFTISNINYYSVNYTKISDETANSINNATENTSYRCVVKSQFNAVSYSDVITAKAISFAGGTDATGTAPTTVYQLEGRTITLPQNTFTKTGYTFIGWKVGTTTYNAGAPYTVGSSDVEFTAVFGHVCDEGTFETKLTQNFLLSNYNENHDCYYLPEGSYYLESDITVDKEISIENNTDVEICLNGHNMIFKGSTFFECNGNLTITDCNEDATNKTYFTIDSTTNRWTYSETETANYVVGSTLYLKQGELSAYFFFVNNHGTLNINNISIVGYYAKEDAFGSIFNCGSTTVYNCTFKGNVSQRDGAAIHNQSELNIYDSIFEYNKSSTVGGAIYSKETDYSYALFITGSTFQYNEASDGGAIYLENSRAVIKDTTITNNKASKGNGAGVTITYAEEGGSCLAEGTSILMADNTHKKIENIKVGDRVKTFDHETGKLVTKEIFSIYTENCKTYGLVLHFSNNKTLTICGEHGLLCKDNLKYVAISKENVNEYINKEFYDAESDTWVKLLSANLTSKTVCYYSVMAKDTIDVIADGMATVSKPSMYMLNTFDLDSSLKIDEAKKQNDINTYGLATYADLVNICSQYNLTVNQEIFDDYKIQYSYIAMGKGIVTLEDFFYSLSQSEKCIKEQVPMLMMFALFSATEDYSNYNVDANILLLGSNVIIQDNKDADGKNSNLYFANTEPLVKVMENATSIDVGITLKNVEGDFAINVYSKNIGFTSDNNKLSIIKTATNETFTYSLSYILEQPTKDNDYTVVVNDNLKEEVTYQWYEDLGTYQLSELDSEEYGIEHGEKNGDSFVPEFSDEYIDSINSYVAEFYFNDNVQCFIEFDSNAENLIAEEKYNKIISHKGNHYIVYSYDGQLTVLSTTNNFTLENVRIQKVNKLTSETEAKFGSTTLNNSFYFCHILDNEGNLVATSESIKPNKITFDVNGATTGTNNVIYQFEGRSINVPDANATKTGYEFAGWNSDKTATVISTFTDGKYTVGASDATLYAIWAHGCTGGKFIMPLSLTDDCGTYYPSYGGFYNAFILKEGSYYLDGDFTLTDSWMLLIDENKPVSLCLNGYTLNLNGGHIVSLGDFSIYDCNDTDKKYFEIDQDDNWTLCADETEHCVIGGLITGGKGMDGGAILANGALKVENVNFVANTSNNGGAIQYSKSADLRNCLFYANNGITGGAVFSNAVSSDNELNVINCEFMYNSADEGGAMNVRGNVLIKGSVFMYNSAEIGGAIFFDNLIQETISKVAIFDTVISQNTATENGAGVYYGAANCFAEGTKITMGDGTEKNIEDIKVGDYVLSFNHFTGKYESHMVYLTYTGDAPGTYFTLNFKSGATLNISGRHDLFEQSSMKYVTVSDTNKDEMIGKYFYNAERKEFDELESVVDGTKLTNYYSIYVLDTTNCIADGMLSVSDDVDYLLNVYSFKSDLTVDVDALEADIALYGEFTLAECKLVKTQEEFEKCHLYLYNVVIGKGLKTREDFERIFYDYYKASNFTDGYSDPMLILGDGAVISDNTVDDDENNVYLSGSAKISVMPGAKNITVGVTLESTTGEFAFDVYSNDVSKIGIYSDNEEYTVKKVLDKNTLKYTYSIDKIITKFESGENAKGSAPEDILDLPTNKITLPECTLTRYGYVFAGWKDGDTTYAAGDKYTVGENDNTLYAVWTKIITAEPSKANDYKVEVSDKTSGLTYKWYKAKSANMSFGDFSDTYDGITLLFGGCSGGSDLYSVENENKIVILAENNIYKIVFKQVTANISAEGLVSLGNNKYSLTPKDGKFTVTSDGLFDMTDVEVYYYTEDSALSGETNAKLGITALENAMYICAVSNGASVVARSTVITPKTVSFAKTSDISGTVPATVYQLEGRKVTIPSVTLTKTNYKLSGWKVGETVYTTEYTVGTGDAELSAYMTQKTAVTVSESAENFTFNNTAHAYEIGGKDKSIGSFKTEYKVGGTWTESAPINAGTYEVRISRAEDATYASYSKEIASGLVILAKEIVITWQVNDHVYDGTVQSISATYKDVNGTDTELAVQTNSEFKNAGTYTATASFKNGETNYKLPENMTNTYIIGKQIASEPTVSGEYKYTGNEQSVAFLGLEEYMTAEGDLNKTESGVYTVTFTLDENYMWSEESDGILTWEIKAVKIATEDDGKEKKTVTVESENGFGSDITVTVEVTLETEVKEKELTVDYYNIAKEGVKLAENEVVGVVFDVKLIRSINGVTKEIQPEDIAPGTIIKVKMLIPDSVDVSKVTKILHVHTKDDIESLEFYAEKIDKDRYYEIEVDRLSEFAFVYKVEDKCINHFLLLALLIALIGFVAIIYFVFKIKSFSGEKKINLTPVIGFTLHLVLLILLALFAKCNICTCLITVNAAVLILFVVLYALKGSKKKEQSRNPASLGEAIVEAEKTENPNVNITKAKICDYIKKTYGDKSVTNNRANYISSGILPLADTHYKVKNGKKICFTYVYELKDGKTFLLIKTDEKTAGEIGKSHNLIKSAFPKTKANDWYTLIIDKSYKSDDEVFEVISIIFEAI